MCPRVSILEEREKARQDYIWKPAERNHPGGDVPQGTGKEGLGQKRVKDMPPSSNKRKSKRGQKRQDNADRGQTETRPQGPRPQPYTVHDPYDPHVPVSRQIDQGIARSVTFEMTMEKNRELGMDQAGFMQSDALSGPGTVTVFIDPASTIQGHPRWKTGADAISELNATQGVSQDKFQGELKGELKGELQNKPQADRAPGPSETAVTRGNVPELHQAARGPHVHHPSPSAASSPGGAE